MSLVDELTSLHSPLLLTLVIKLSNFLKAKSKKIRNFASFSSPSFKITEL